MTIENRKRIAIAKEFGWTEVTNFHQALRRYEYRISDGHIYTSIHTDMPDYLGDLNAAHEMEKALNEEQWLDYTEHLCDNGPCPGWCGFNIAHATAAQRADAFIKVLNLEY